VDLTYKGLMHFIYKGLKLRTTRRYRLDGLGLEVFRMIEGTKSFEVLIDETRTAFAFPDQQGAQGGYAVFEMAVGEVRFHRAETMDGFVKFAEPDFAAGRVFAQRKPEVIDGIAPGGTGQQTGLRRPYPVTEPHNRLIGSLLDDQIQLQSRLPRDRTSEAGFRESIGQDMFGRYCHYGRFQCDRLSVNFHYRWGKAKAWFFLGRSQSPKISTVRKNAQ
jgi:hypothetical protein